MEFGHLVRKLREIRTPDIDEIVKSPEYDPGADSRALGVMISSPLRIFAEERDAIRQTMSPYGDVETRLFEKMVDSGSSNVSESIRLANQCDLFISLIDPTELGSIVPSENLDGTAFAMDSGDKVLIPRVRYYSEIEILTAMARRREGRWPPIFIYVRDRQNAGAGLTLSGWHAEVASNTAPKYFQTEGQLAAMIELDLLGNIIEIRSSRARYLASELKKAKDELNVAESRHGADKMLLEVHKSEIQGLKAELTDMRSNYERREIALRDGMVHELRIRTDSSERLESQFRADLKSADLRHAASHAGAVYEVQALREAINKLHARALNDVSRGALLVGAPFLAICAMLVAWLTWSGAAEVLRNSGSLIASTLASRPLLVGQVESDPALLYSKLSLAKALGVDPLICRTPAGPGLDVTLRDEANRELAARNLSLRRESICQSFGPFMIDADSEEFANCKSAVSDRQWRAISAAAKGAGLEIAKVRLLGHASSAPIKAPCNKMSEELFRSTPAQVRTALDLRDLQVRSNAQLAYWRGREAEQALRGAVPGVDVSVDILGVLDEGPSTSRNRRVSMAIYLQRVVPLRN